MKWTLPAVRGTAAPVPRHRHSAACARDKVSRTPSRLLEWACLSPHLGLACGYECVAGIAIPVHREEGGGAPVQRACWWDSHPCGQPSNMCAGLQRIVCFIWPAHACTCTRRVFSFARLQSSVTPPHGPQVFIFGGQTEQGQLLNDVWEWHMDTMHWVQLNYFQAAGAHRWACLGVCSLQLCGAGSGQP